MMLYFHQDHKLKNAFQSSIKHRSRRWEDLFTFLWVTLFVCASFLSPSTVKAQEADGATDFSFFIGNMLPNQIDGIAEILPVFGGRYGLGLGAAAIEIEGENSHSMGVDWTSFGANFRGELKVGQGLSGFVYAGPDWHYYSPKNAENRQSEYGLHFGVAGVMLVKDSLWLRADLKLMGNPGTALYLLFGLHFRPGGAQ